MGFTLFFFSETNKTRIENPNNLVNEGNDQKSYICNINLKKNNNNLKTKSNYYG